MKTIFLHIGTHKTGSTTIQEFLSRNRLALAKLGYCYPFQSLSHCNLAVLAKQAQHTLTNSPKTWQELHEFIDRSECDRIILSSEGFFDIARNSQHLENLKQQLDRYRVRVIAFVRRQDLYFESFYSQHIKMGTVSGDINFYVDECCQSNYHNYWNPLWAWSQAFGGVENIQVFPFEKSQIPNLCATFLSAIDISGDRDWTSIGSHNIKPSLDQFRALKFINLAVARYLGHSIPGSYQLNAQFQFQQKVPVPFLKYSQGWDSPKTYKLVPYELASRLLERCQPSNAKIAEVFLGRNDGQLFYQDLQRYDCAELEIEHLGRDRLAELCYFLKSHGDRQIREIGDRRFSSEICRLAESQFVIRTLDKYCRRVRTKLESR